MKYSEEEEMEIENQLAEMLAHVYVNIPWQKIGVKSAHKFFVDRIRAASGTRDVKEFLDTFTKKCEFCEGRSKSCERFEFEKGFKHESASKRKCIYSKLIIGTS